MNPTQPAPAQQTEFVIRAHNLSKTFRVYHRPHDRLREKFSGKVLHHEHRALADISFDLKPGEALAILGANGAGKSTLLKLITGILLPDTGEVQTRGRIAGLLELGTGFDGNLTGLQNIRSNAGLLGLAPAEIDEQLSAIIAFSELGDYIGAPVRTYSSGMVMRLGFSIAIHTQPLCFVVDEALSVGDARFQQKCLLKIQAFRQSGGSLLFVSHDLNAVKVLCDRAIVLDRGHVSYDGEPQAACLVYQKQMMQLDAKTSSERYGKGAVRIASVRMENAAGFSGRFASGEAVTIKVRIDSDTPTQTLSLGFMIRDRLGQDLFGTNTHLQEQVLSLQKDASCEVAFELMLNLGPGQYTLTLGLHDSNNYTDDVQDWWNDSLIFEIDYAGRPDFVGVCPLPVTAITSRIL